MPRKTRMPKEATSIRLTPEAKQLFARLADSEGLSQAAWLEMIIRKEARRKKIRVPAEGDSDDAEEELLVAA